MKNHLDNFKQMLNDAGIKFDQMDKTGKDGNMYYDCCITIGEGTGYSGFAATFYFMNGSLVSHACYE